MRSKVILFHSVGACQSIGFLPHLSFVMYSSHQALLAFSLASVLLPKLIVYEEPGSKGSRKLRWHKKRSSSHVEKKWGKEVFKISRGSQVPLIAGGWGRVTISRLGESWKFGYGALGRQGPQWCTMPQSLLSKTSIFSREPDLCILGVSCNFGGSACPTWWLRFLPQFDLHQLADETVTY